MSTRLSPPSFTRQQCFRATNKRWREQHKHEPKWWAAKRHTAIKALCKKHSIPFDITSNDILACVPYNFRCPVLGILLVFGQPGQPHNAPSVDRIIPSIGYVKWNIRVISWRANALKGDVTDPDELQKVVDDLRRFL
jgi:hypothetical protein